MKHSKKYINTELARIRAEIERIANWQRLYDIYLNIDRRFYDGGKNSKHKTRLIREYWILKRELAKGDLK